MYAVHDIQHQIYGSKCSFFIIYTFSLHVSEPDCDTRHPICESNFFFFFQGRNQMSRKITEYFVEK